MLWTHLETPFSGMHLYFIPKVVNINRCAVKLQRHYFWWPACSMYISSRLLPVTSPISPLFYALNKLGWLRLSCLMLVIWSEGVLESSHILAFRFIGLHERINFNSFTLPTTTLFYSNDALIIIMGVIIVMDVCHNYVMPSFIISDHFHYSQTWGQLHCNWYWNIDSGIGIGVLCLKSNWNWWKRNWYFQLHKLFN